MLYGIVCEDEETREDESDCNKEKSEPSKRDDDLVNRYNESEESDSYKSVESSLPKKSNYEQYNFEKKDFVFSDETVSSSDGNICVIDDEDEHDVTTTEPKQKELEEPKKVEEDSIQILSDDDDVVSCVTLDDNVEDKATTSKKEGMNFLIFLAVLIRISRYFYPCISYLFYHNNPNRKLLVSGCLTHS